MAFFDELDKLILSQQESQSNSSEFFAALGAPSVSIAILDHGEITTRCYSTVGDHVKTRFQACSISKPVTALAVMRLVDQGRLKLDDKIANFLPEVIVNNLGAAAVVQEITIAQILSHTAGLTQGGFPGYSEIDHPNATDIVLGNPGVNTMPIKVAGIPGHQWQYSGGGYVLLQIALEHITSLPFPKLMDELVLQPLDMHDSCYGMPEEDADLARAYLTSVTPCSAPWHYLPESAAAGLWTTPADLCKVLRASQRALAGSESTFLRTDTAKSMLTEVGSNSMSLGWVAPRDPGTWFGHTGSNDPGYRCVAMGIADLLGLQKTDSPNAECGIAVMTNSAEGVQPMLTAMQTIIYLKNWPQASTGSKMMSLVRPLELNSSEIRGDWKDWQGRWNDDTGQWIIDADGDGLPQARWGDSRPIKLLPAAICPKVFAEGKSLDLVFSGLGAMLRLAWRDGERSVDYMDSLTNKTNKLSRAESGAY